MNPSQSVPVIRLIKLILDVLWFGTIVWVALALAIWLVMSGSWHLPFYWTDVTLDPAAVHYSIKLPSGHPLQVSTPYPHNNLEAKGRLAIEPPDRFYAVVYIGSRFLTGVLVFAILYLLRQLFGALKHGSPFTAENAGRIRGIGLLIFLGSFLVHLLDFGLRFYLYTQVQTKGLDIRLKFEPNYKVLFLGLVLLAIAELFRHGVKLEEERALTI